MLAVQSAGYAGRWLCSANLMVAERGFSRRSYRITRIRRKYASKRLASALSLSLQSFMGLWRISTSDEQGSAAGILLLPYFDEFDFLLPKTPCSSRLHERLVTMITASLCVYHSICPKWRQSPPNSNFGHLCFNCTIIPRFSLQSLMLIAHPAMIYHSSLYQI